MSRLNDLLKRVQSMDPNLGSELLEEVREFTKRRTFGLVFEPHQPEAVHLPQRRVRKGDKVRVLPPRGSLEIGDKRLWRVSSFETISAGRSANLTEIGSADPEHQVSLVEDLVVVAEFHDRIYPGLVETGRIERGGDKPFHSVINAENFHALELLTYTHRHSLDAIYIDPPYNTGAKDWKYNNDYVEGDDDYRHSKWLAFMERRLRIAQELLNPDDSVLIVTIDEKEYLRLGLLLEQTFPEARVQMVTIVINPNGVARGAELARVEEYAYFCFFGKGGPARLHDTFLDQGNTKVKHKVRWEWLMRGGSNSRRIDRPNLFYPIYINAEKKIITEVGEPLPLDLDPATEATRPGLTTLWPVRANGTQANWRTSPEYLRELLATGYAKLGAFDKATGRWSVLYLGKAQIRRIDAGEITVVGRAPDGSLIVEGSEMGPTSTPKTVWNRSQHSAGEYGSRMIRAMLPTRDFPFPKSLYAVEDALKVILKDKPEAKILDFFSGSGTTAHAVMRLNRQDGGRRQCISVTNNEVSADEQARLRKQGLRPGDGDWEILGICDYITKPRITSAISGYTPQGEPLKGDYKFTDEFPMAEGFEENAAFFTLTYEGPLSVAHHRAFSKIAPLLWMRAGSQGRCIDSLGDQGWDVAETYGVLENLDNARDFIRALSEADGGHIAYIVTDDGRAFQMVCANLPAHVTPVRLYESYLTNFEINSARKG